MIETTNLPLVRGGSRLADMVSVRDFIEHRAIAGESMAIVTPSVRAELTPPMTLYLDPLTMDQKASLFLMEKTAFIHSLPQLMPQYEGRFVAIHRGAVVDADQSRSALIRRFLQNFGDTHVYIGYVGRTPPTSHVVTPFRS